jgi:2-hydroxy-3-keto-5-methylthiopentenyl-1-phosphate phosphatase
VFRTKKVAAIFDFDKTLAPDYMQKVVFDYYHTNEDQFWQDCQQWSEENMRTLGSNHSELSYMNMFLRYVKDGRMAELSNAKLRQLGRRIEVYPGVDSLLSELFDMGVEIYIVSSGIRMLLHSFEDRIRETTKNPKFKIHGVYGGDFREDPHTGWIDSIASVVSPSDKLRAIYEISKGCDIYGYAFTASIPKENGRRVPLEMMMYVGDGYSDIPCFNLIHDSGGFTLGVFDADNFEQIERIRAGGRLSSVAVADYSAGSTAYEVIKGKARELLFKCSEEYELRQSVAELRQNKIAPVHPWSIVNP